MDIFKKINTAVLDLQGTDFQSYMQHMKKLRRFLQDDTLAEFNDVLTKDVDINKFLEEANKTGGSMMGSKSLNWPDDAKDELGLKLLLIYKFAEERDFMWNFGSNFYYSGNKEIIYWIRSIIDQIIIPFVRDYKEYFEETRPKESETMSPKPSPTNTKEVFIVHGHDGEALQGVARFIEKIGLTSIILHEQVNKGKTIIEKIEKHKDVGFAVVLLTPDDKLTDKDSKPVSRARQNVILELGYFLGGLGRDKVCVLKKGGVEMPSDFEGVVWVELDKYNGWQMRLIKELKAAGYSPEIPQ